MFDFYDMKGRLELTLNGLHLTDVVYAPAESTQPCTRKSAEVKNQSGRLWDPL